MKNLNTQLMSRPTKAIIPVFFIVDTSIAHKISGGWGVVEWIENIIRQLIYANYYACDEFQFAILTFGGKVNWVTGNHGLVRAEQCCLQELSFDGPAQLAAAFCELDAKLSIESILRSLRSDLCMRPNLILFNSSSTTRDRNELEKSLNKLKENGWYKASIKIAIGYGNSVDDDIMLKFVDGVHQNYINISKSPGLFPDWLYNKIEAEHFYDDLYLDDFVPVGRCSLECALAISKVAKKNLAAGTDRAAEEIKNLIAEFEPSFNVSNIDRTYDLDEEW